MSSTASGYKVRRTANHETLHQFALYQVWSLTLMLITMAPPMIQGNTRATDIHTVLQFHTAVCCSRFPLCSQDTSEARYTANLGERGSLTRVQWFPATLPVDVLRCLLVPPPYSWQSPQLHLRICMLILKLGSSKK